LFSPYPTTRYSSFPRITLALIIVCVVVYLLELVGGDQVILLLAQTGGIFFQGFYWQPFTAMFVHFDILHILFNMFALFYFGRLNEDIFSRWQFLAVYLGSGLLGNVASLFLLAPDVPSGGASGAIFGLIGSYVATERKADNLIVGLLYAFLIFVQSAGPGVNIFAHFFGLAGGFVLGLLFLSSKPADR